MVHGDALPSPQNSISSYVLSLSRWTPCTSGDKLWRSALSLATPTTISQSKRSTASISPFKWEKQGTGSKRRLLVSAIVTNIHQDHAEGLHTQELHFYGVLVHRRPFAPLQRQPETHTHEPALRHSVHSSLHYCEFQKIRAWANVLHVLCLNMR